MLFITMGGWALPSDWPRCPACPTQLSKDRLRIRRASWNSCERKWEKQCHRIDCLWIMETEEANLSAGIGRLSNSGPIVMPASAFITKQIPHWDSGFGGRRRTKRWKRRKNLLLEELLIHLISLDVSGMKDLSHSHRCYRFSVSFPKREEKKTEW